MNDQGHPAKSGGACAVWSGAGLTARTASCHPIALCGDLSEQPGKTAVEVPPGEGAWLAQAHTS